MYQSFFKYLCIITVQYTKTCVIDILSK